jgi:Domain of unknown function (DUF5076)
MADSLPIPDAALRDPRALHMASLWIAEGALHCNVKVGVYDGRADVTEAKAWGVILASMTRLIADAMIADGRHAGPRETAINEIWAAYHEELSTPSPTS